MSYKVDYETGLHLRNVREAAGMRFPIRTWKICLTDHGGIEGFKTTRLEKGCWAVLAFFFRSMKTLKRWSLTFLELELWTCSLQHKLKLLPLYVTLASKIIWDNWCYKTRSRNCWSECWVTYLWLLIAQFCC